jgi:ABC-type multidrug transport system fused ATPase/permease subunit/pSer/pThr/pTyr-binding forkhead associated (FHA) protein
MLLGEEAAMFLIKFLYRNLQGYRVLVLLAILVAFAQVSSDIIALQPLKWIPSKAQNPGNDPACTFPFLGLNNNPGLLDWFDTPALDPSLNPPPGGHQVVPPPTSPCPADPARPQTFITPDTTHHSVIGVIVFSVIVLVIFSTLSAILVYVDLFLAAYIAQGLSSRLRKQLFEHLQRLSLDWHGKQKKGDLVQRITSNIADIEKFVTDGLVDLLVGFLTIGGVAAIMLFYSVPYTVLSLAIVPAMAVIVLYYTRTIKAAAKKQAKSAAQVADVATEDINALTVIKVFTREEREDMRFGGRVGENRSAGLRTGKLQAQFTPLVAILVALGTATVLGVGGYVAAGNPFSAGPFKLAAGTIDAGLIVSYLFYLKLLYQPLRDLSKLTTLANAASAGAERIQEVLDQAPELVETTAPYHGPTKFQGNITFENVYFSYSPERPPVLKGINLHIAAGKRVALVGLSGGGKTTLVKLIPRFYEIQQGSVKIDGNDNRNFPLTVLRQNISMVLQDSVLFEGTFRENIEVGRPGASEAEIIDAAKKAQIHETIMAQPDGYNTLIREQGKNLSGGQRQRMAIARAILRDAPILILDEPTASLDVESEAEVMRALDTLIVGRTVIVISHRLSTLGNVDEIIVLSDGRIVEKGTYKELKRMGGVFAHMLDEQSRYSAERVAGDQSILRSAFVPLPVGGGGDDLWRARPAAAAAPGGQQNWPIPVPQPSGFPGGPPSQPGSPPIPPTPARNSSPGFNGDGLRPLPQRARVKIEVDGKDIGVTPLNKPVMTIGRLSANDIQVPSPRVSRLHARMRWDNGMWVIEDADSLNGITYKGNRVDRQPISIGDRIVLAPGAVLTYETF